MEEHHRAHGIQKIDLAEQFNNGVFGIPSPPLSTSRSSSKKKASKAPKEVLEAERLQELFEGQEKAINFSIPLSSVQRDIIRDILSTFVLSLAAGQVALLVSVDSKVRALIQGFFESVKSYLKNQPKYSTIGAGAVTIRSLFPISTDDFLKKKLQISQKLDQIAIIPPEISLEFSELFDQSLDFFPKEDKFSDLRWEREVVKSTADFDEGTAAMQVEMKKIDIKVDPVKIKVLRKNAFSDEIDSSEQEMSDL